MQVVKGQPGIGDWLLEFGAHQAAPDITRVKQAALGWDVGRTGHDDAGDAAVLGRHRRERVGGRNEAKDGPGERLTGHDELVVEARARFLEPRIPTLGALEGGGLYPVLAIRRYHQDVVAQRPEEGDDDVAIGIAETLTPGAGNSDRVAIGIEDDVAATVPFVLAAYRVAKDVVRDLAKDIVDAGAKALESLLARGIELAVGHGPIVKDPDDHRGRR